MAQVRSEGPVFNDPLRDALRAFAVPSSTSQGESGFALVRSGPPVPDVEVDEVGVMAVEVVILWGSSLLHVAHLAPPRPFVIGETEDCDYVVPASVLGRQRLELIAVQDGHAMLAAPAAAHSNVVESDDAARVAASLVDGTRLELGTRRELCIGSFTIRVACVHAARRAPRQLVGREDRSGGVFFGMTALVAAGLLGTIAFFTPPLGLVDEADRDEARLIAIQQILESAAEREQEQTPGTRADDRPAGSQTSGERARGESGAAGKPLPQPSSGRMAIKGDRNNAEAAMPREAALHEVRTFGLLGLLTNSAAIDAPTAPWGRDDALGNDDVSAHGDLWSDDIKDAAGFGGLGPSGTGIGGGGRGDQIGMGDIQTCGGLVCAGLPGGFGRSLARTGPNHKPGAPRVRPAGDTTVSGRLPPEVIQRIVRQNFGRFRQCYENGLRTNPNLEGRVAVRFVIARDGSVANAGNAGSDLPDSGVVSCVVSTYYGLSFPAPDNGIVSVSYPILFSPS